MLRRRSITIARGQVATSEPGLSGPRLRMIFLRKGSNQRQRNGQTVAGLGSSGLAEPWTLYQGGAFGRTSNWKYHSRSFVTISKQRIKGRSFPTERTTSSQWPSGILSTLDGHEARQAPFRGVLGFRTQAVTNATRGGRKCSRPKC